MYFFDKFVIKFIIFVTVTRKDLSDCKPRKKNAKAELLSNSNLQILPESKYNEYIFYI